MFGSCKETVVVFQRRGDYRSEGIQTVEETEIVSLTGRSEEVQVHIAPGFDGCHPSSFDAPEFMPCDGVWIVSL
jgi:hypothetical protein